MKLALICVALALMIAETESVQAKNKQDYDNLWTCLACASVSGGMEGRLEYADCVEILSEEVRNAHRGCEKKLVPDYEMKSDTWELMCEQKKSKPGEIFDCYLEAESKLKLSENDKKRLEEFDKCAFEILGSVCGRYVPSSVKRERAMKFMRCMGCSTGTKETEMNAEYEKCATKRPDRYKKIESECWSENGQSSKQSEVFKAFCKDPSITGKVYDCELKKESDQYAKTTDSEKAQQKSFKECLAHIDVIYCKKIPPIKGIPHGYFE